MVFVEDVVEGTKKPPDLCHNSVAQLPELVRPVGTREPCGFKFNHITIQLGSKRLKHLQQISKIERQKPFFASKFLALACGHFIGLNSFQLPNFYYAESRGVPVGADRLPIVLT